MLFNTNTYYNNFSISHPRLNFIIISSVHLNTYVQSYGTFTIDLLANRVFPWSLLILFGNSCLSHCNWCCWLLQGIVGKSLPQWTLERCRNVHCEKKNACQALCINQYGYKSTHTSTFIHKNIFCCQYLWNRSFCLLRYPVMFKFKWCIVCVVTKTTNPK